MFISGAQIMADGLRRKILKVLNGFSPRRKELTVLIILQGKRKNHRKEEEALEKEKWEMTFPQYCQDYLANCRYKAAYEADPKKLPALYATLLPAWVKELEERAQAGPIPSPVLMSFIRQFDEGVLFRTFRGNCAPGISRFRIPASSR